MKFRVAFGVSRNIALPNQATRKYKGRRLTFLEKEVLFSNFGSRCFRDFPQPQKTTKGKINNKKKAQQFTTQNIIILLLFQSRGGYYDIVTTGLSFELLW